MKKTEQIQPMDRRTFVKATGLTAGGLMLAPNLLAAKAHIDGDDAIRIALIGCGGRGTGAAFQALSTKQNVKLVAMADAFQNRLDQSYHNIKEELSNNDLAPERLAVPKEHQFVGFDAYQKVLPLCDVVILATPPGFRPMHFEAAVKAGKQIFMEKPVAVDAPGVRRVLEAAKLAKEKKLNVVVGLQRHYQQEYIRWVELMQEGAIGEITTSHVYWNSGGVWVRDRESNMTEMAYQMTNWYYFNWLCGDHITEQHIHNIDVSNWVKRAYPVSARGMGGRRMRTGKEHGEIFDHHFLEFEYADGSTMMSQCRHWQGCENMVTERFQGTNGHAPKPGVLLTRSGHVLLEHDSKKDANPYQVEHDVLFEAIANGDYKFSDAENAAKSTMTSILGRMATYSGQLVKWDEAIASTLSLSPEKYDWDANPPILPGEDGYYPVAMPGVTKVM
ncbi:MAG: oxidoreductase [Saprospiraceae bacterium]|nr:MAG: oxidoreductase [Saprospiraceae bacterium]